MINFNDYEIDFNDAREMINFNDYEIDFNDAWDNLPDVDALFKTKKEKKASFATEKMTTDKGFWTWWKKGGEYYEKRY